MAFVEGACRAWHRRGFPVRTFWPVTVSHYLRCPSAYAQVRFGTSNSCSFGGPVPEPDASDGVSRAVIEDPSDCSINIADDVTAYAANRLCRLAQLALPPPEDEKPPTPVARVRKFR